MENNLVLNVENINDFKPVGKTCATVTTQSESLTEQTAVTPTVISAGAVYVKLPVILAETNITIPVEATITLDQPAMEIKRIKKNVYLTQTRLIPFSASTSAPNSGIVFISGFIRKNIEYATQTCSTPKNQNVCGDIRHCTVEVPFNFTTRVEFDSTRLPIFAENNPVSELGYFTDEIKSCDICADPVYGHNPCDQNFVFTEVFNEKPFVELIEATITEVDIHKKPMLNYKNPTEQMFTELTEKIIVNLTLKILQKQQVRVTAIS